LVVQIDSSQNHCLVVADVINHLEVHLADHSDVVSVHKDNMVHRDCETFRSLVAGSFLISFTFSVLNMRNIFENEFLVATLVIIVNILRLGVLSIEKLGVVEPAKTSDLFYP